MTVGTSWASITRKYRVGLIVAGAIFSGLALSPVLVVVVFGGDLTARHALAFGWALLAGLSVRWSDQPQQWAAVPAAVMALAGVGLLTFRPDANAMNFLACRVDQRAVLGDLVGRGVYLLRNRSLHSDPREV